jgi:uncharacterized oligopeptide transporter (OPT) family protein
MAAGQTLILLDSHGEQGRRSAFAMVGALAASALTFLATTFRWVIDSIPVVVNAFSARVGLGFGVSLLSIGTGIIIGLRVSTSMFIGGIIGWVIAPPLLLERGLITADARRVDILLTMMWPAVGMLVAAGMCGLLLRWNVLTKTFKALSVEGASQDFPLRWVGIGVAISAAALVFVQKQFFGAPIWQSLVAIVVAVPLGLVALRVLGETNWGPISAMTNVTQAIFGFVAPGDLRAGMVSSGTTAAVAAESEGLMQDFRAGQMIGSTPRILTYMQLIAVPVGALALAYMYPLLRDTYGIIGDQAQLLSPTSQRWVGFAKLVTQELSGPGASSPEAIARLSWITWSATVGAIIGIALAWLEQKESWRPFIPSPAGMGIAMLIPVNAVTMIFTGALVDRVWKKIDPVTQERYSIPMASGLIAGEALVAIVLPLLVTLGLMQLP